MTSRLLTPWGTRSARTALLRAEAPGANLAPTPILDWTHPAVGAFVASLHSVGDTPMELLRRAHLALIDDLRPVYGVRERRRASRTLLSGRGSCSQRLAVLEAVARAAGIPSRAHGLLLDGRFWYSRAGRWWRLVPDQVVLAWPEFLLDGRWLPVSELHAGLLELASSSDGTGFTNDTGETLFEAVRRTAVDWDGRTRHCAAGCDLSAVVLADLGTYPSRDALFAAHGETFCLPVRPMADAMLSRRAARPAVSSGQ